MLVQADKVFVTACPLSELVWSPHKGLGLKCTDSSTVERKTSLWWSSESLNVIFSAPRCGTVGDACGNGTLADNCMQLVPNSSSKDNMNVTSPGRMGTVSLTKTDRQHSTSFEEIGGLQGTAEISMRNVQDKEADMFLCRDDNANDDLRGSTEMVVGKTSVAGTGEDQSVGSLSPNLEDLKDKLETSCRDKMLVEKTIITRDDGRNKKLSPAFTCFEHFGRKNLAGIVNPISTINAPYQGSSFFSLFTSHGGGVTGVGRSEPAEGIKDGIYKSFLSDKNTDAESSAGKVRDDLNKRKGKEAVSGENSGALKKRARVDSDESVESSDSKEFSTTKRAWCFASEGEPLSSKKLKKTSNVNSPPGPLSRKDSSFMNWISGVAKGFSSSIITGTALTVVQKPSESKQRNSYSLVYLDKEGNGHKNASFQSFVQALYLPKSKTQQFLTEDHCHQQELNESTKLHTINEDLKLLQPLPLTTLKASGCHLDQCPSTAQNSYWSNSPVLGKVQNTSNKNHTACNWVSSSPSIWDDSNPPVDKDSPKPDSAVPKKTNDLKTTSEGCEFLGSFWVTRLYPKAVPLAYSMKSNLVTGSSAERQVGSHNANLPHPQHPHQCLVNKDKRDKMEKQEHSTGPSDSSSWKRVANDQKLKTKLSPILPSPRLKQLEPMASVFAKRLDAFRHIKTSGIVDDIFFSTHVCFFCGQSGHSLKDCSHIKGSQLEDLQKNINLYVETQKSSCLCIRCFQLNHWAIACPLLTKKVDDPREAGASFATPINGEAGQEQPVNFTSFTIADSRCEISNTESPNFGFLRNVGSAMNDRALCFLGETKMKGKHGFSIPGSILSKGNHIIPSNIKRKEMLDEKIQVFEEVRKLRLSRSVLARGIKAHLNLEGFFLRVQIGKYGHTQGSGYHVAYICGESLEKSHGSSQRHIYASIASSKYLIDHRFISNNDFIEDELNAWWSATIEGGGKLPTVAELSKKLQERKRFNL